MDWTEDAIARLKLLWAEGHSTAEIGRRMGVSKNAVVGKAHRLALPARPSPIRREGTARPRPPAVRRVTGPTLPPLVAAALPAIPPAAPPPRLAVVRPPREAAPATRFVARPIPCCWPIGEPGTKSFSFCGCASLPGKPYCAEHAALAYVKVRDRREDAA